MPADTSFSRNIDVASAKIVAHNNQSIQVIPAFHAPIHEQDCGFIMTVNHSNKLEPISESCHALMMRIVTSIDRTKQNPKNEVVKHFVGQSVLDRACRNAKRKVVNVDFSLNPQSEVDYNGRLIKIVDYIWEVSSMKIKDMKQPIFVYEEKIQKKKVERYMVPELCIMPNQMARDNLNPTIIQEIKEQTRRNPDESMELVKSFHQKLTTEEVTERSENFGLYVEKELLSFMAKQLPQQKLKFRTRNDQTETTIKPQRRGNWEKELDNYTFWQGPKNLERFTVIVEKRDSKELQDFLKEVNTQSKNFKWRVAKHSTVYG